MKTLFNLTLLEGTWESVNLHPTVLVYRNYSGVYYLVVLHMNEHSKQAQLSVYEILQNESGYCIGYSFNYQYLSYDFSSDTLILSVFGRYMRN